MESHAVVSADDWIAARKALLAKEKGRDEAGHDNPQFWVRRHDEYGS